MQVASILVRFRNVSDVLHTPTALMYPPSKIGKVFVRLLYDVSEYKYYLWLYVRVFVYLSTPFGVRLAKLTDCQTANERV
jgi:hypothetical protein